MNDVKQRFAPGNGILATDYIAKENRKVTWMYRQQPRHKGDSGWRVFSGLETQEYVDNPDHSRYYNSETIVEIDPTIRPYLAAAIGAAFEWDAGAEVFRPVYDFDTTEE